MFSLRPVLLISLVLIIITCASCSPQLTKIIPPVLKPTSSPCCLPQSPRAITLAPKPIASSCGTFPSGKPMPVGNIPGWRQVFADDFNGTTLNTSNWYPYSGQPGGGFRPGGGTPHPCRKETACLLSRVTKTLLPNQVYL